MSRTVLPAKGILLGLKSAYGAFAAKELRDLVILNFELFSFKFCHLSRVVWSIPSPS